MRTFVMGDIHGCYEGLKQCLARSNFNYDEDTLIQLGDVCDGWSDVYLCVEELLKIKNLIAIRGNHDVWFYPFLQYGMHQENWRQGGDGTANSYLKHLNRDPAEWNKYSGWLVNLLPEDIPTVHHQFFLREQRDYYLDDKKRLFIHGGFNRHYHLSEQPKHVFWWDRDLWSQALTFNSMVSTEGMPPPKFTFKDDISEVYIGHTATTYWDKDVPMSGAEGKVWNLDTGAGWTGRLTIMDVDTKEYWQSDLTPKLYPDEMGRRNWRAQ